MTSATEPKLAAPGAGLPFPELLIARMFFALKRWSGSRESFTAEFHQGRAAIRRLVEACDQEALLQRVLIQRVKGLEDSSRYWSVAMTLDHLRIVHQRLIQIVTSLANHQVPPGQVSTADVKPDPAVSVSILAEYEASCDAWLTAVAKVPQLKTAARYAHPWFGPMDAFSWHALAGIHLKIHRVQLERILAGLKNASK